MGFRSLLGLFGYRRPSERAAALLAAIMTSSSDAIASQTLDGIITSWNPAAQKLFGYTEQEMIGQSITRLVLPGREKEERHILAQIAAGIQVTPYETLRIRKDGMVLAVSVSVAPIVNKTGRVIGAAKIARAIGDRSQTRTEEALRESEERCRSVISTAVDAIIVIDETGAIQSINPAGERMLGYTSNELIGNNVLMIMPSRTVRPMTAISHLTLRRDSSRSLAAAANSNTGEKTARSSRRNWPSRNGAPTASAISPASYATSRSANAMKSRSAC
jgi:PAS domain S-box-containing protein